ncbi:hypothetical protein B0H11DRAFT_2246970 [Mycena galericulata]|nr:hypothetical protein B0H11DRAFT_2246970 [Mycena galericulata]
MYRSQHSVTGPMKNYTLSEQTELASKTVRKVRAFLHGASRFEAREFGISDGEMVERGGTVLKGGELQVGERYFVRWDYQGEAGDDFWKFRGDGGQVDSICMMEESMADDPSIGMPGNLLQMAASSWAQNFYDMAANYEGFGNSPSTLLCLWLFMEIRVYVGSVLRPQAPQPQRQYDPKDEDYDEEDDYPVN